jgi:hypothetical protein
MIGLFAVVPPREPGAAIGLLMHPRQLRARPLILGVHGAEPTTARRRLRAEREA